MWTGSDIKLLAPEMCERGGRGVFRGAYTELLTDALAELLVHIRDAGFAIEFDEAVTLGHDFEFALDHGLVADEGPIQIVRQGHVATGFPIADGLGFFKFTAEGGFGADVEPESQMWPESHSIEASHVIAIDAADYAARD